LDIDRLKKVANALPKDRFDVYVLISKLAPFTANEIAAAKTLTSQYQNRVILLTSDELEPYHVYDRLSGPLKPHVHAGSGRQLAEATAMIYLPRSPPGMAEQPDIPASQA
jgi:hypothetical protein